MLKSAEEHYSNDHCFACRVVRLARVVSKLGSVCAWYSLFPTGVDKETVETRRLLVIIPDFVIIAVRNTKS